MSDFKFFHKNKGIEQNPLDNVPDLVVTTESVIGSLFQTASVLAKSLNSRETITPEYIENFLKITKQLEVSKAGLNELHEMLTDLAVPASNQRSKS